MPWPNFAPPRPNTAWPQRRLDPLMPSHTAEHSSASRLRLLGVVALIFGLTVLAYVPALRGGMLWDDEAHVTRPDLRSLDGLWRIWTDLRATQQYYPLLHSAFWAECQLWGDATLCYHLTNVLQHALAASLFYLILRRLRIAGALLAAVVFALHPVHVESVAWITEQKNTLSALFYLAAALIYLRFDEKRSGWFYGLATTLFILGLLSKTVTATLPAALLVVFWWRRGHLSWKRDVTPLIPWFMLGAAGGLFTAWGERKFLGAEGAAYDLTLLQRCLLAGRVVWFYLGKLFWPARLMFIYPRWEVSASLWRQYLFPIAAMALGAGLWLIRGRTRAPLAAFLFFVGTLFPVLGFFNVYPFVYSFVADHFQYLASLGIIAAVCAGLVRVLQLFPRWAGVTTSTALVAMLFALTWRESGIYGDVQGLYRATIARNPDCWLAYNNLAIELQQAGQTPEAVENLQQALRINPACAEAHRNLGVALQHSDPDAAREHFAQAGPVQAQLLQGAQRSGRCAGAGRATSRSDRTVPPGAEDQPRFRRGPQWPGPDIGCPRPRQRSDPAFRAGAATQSGFGRSVHELDARLRQNRSIDRSDRDSAARADGRPRQGTGRASGTDSGLGEPVSQ